MTARQFSTFLVIVVVALTALVWRLHEARVDGTDDSPALSPLDGAMSRTDPELEVIGVELVSAREVPREARELDDLSAEAPARGEAAADEATPIQSAPDTWKSEYAAYTPEQLDNERRALLERVGREKHAIGFEKLNRGEGVIMGRGEKPADEAFAPAPGAMTVFRSGPDDTGSILWERVDLVEADHPELFELDAKMRWVNQEWATRGATASGLPGGQFGPK